MARDVDDDLLQAAMAVSRAFVAVMARTITAGPTDVTLPQVRALLALSEDQPRTMTGLASDLDLSPSSCTRLVERLERKGLVRRIPSSVNRRQVELNLEPAGVELVAVVMAERRRAFEELFAGLPAERVDEVRRAFVEVAGLAGETAGPYGRRQLLTAGMPAKRADR